MFTCRLRLRFFYGKYDQSLIRLTIDSCQYVLLEPARKDYGSYFFKTPFFIPGPTTIDENGLFVSFKRLNDSSIIARTSEIHGYQPLIKNYGPFTVGQGYGSPNGVTSSGAGGYYLSSNAGIIYLNIYDSITYQLNDYPADGTGELVYRSGELFAQSVFYGPTGSLLRIAKLNPSSGSILDTFSVISASDLPLFSLGGMSSSFMMDCSGWQLALPMEQYPPPPGSFVPTYIGLLDFQNQPEPFELACLGETPLIRRNGTSSFEFMSWESHRQTCEIRLDLDADDSEGRAGPHYRLGTYCQTLFSLMDSDATLWTVDDRTIDSVTVAITRNEAPGVTEQYLRYPTHPQFSVQSYGDTAIVIHPVAPGLAYADWLAYLAELRLEVPEPQTSGMRVTETIVHADGIASDGARSFIDVRAGIPSAGPDRDFDMCRYKYYHEDSFLDQASPGGRWEPELTRNPSIPYDFNVYQFDSLGFGIFNYILQYPGCEISDTAAINFKIHPALAQYNPEKYDTVQLCAGGSYRWQPGNIPILKTGRFGNSDYSNNFADSFRIFTEPGSHEGFLNYSDEVLSLGIPCFENISLTLLPNPDSFLIQTLDTTICSGSALVLGDQTYSETGTYELLVAGEGCDTSYTLDLTVLNVPPAVGLDTAVCAGETIGFGGRQFSAFGGYAFSDTTNGCPTAYSLQLSPLPALPVSSDTTLCAGAAIAFGGELLTQAGVYHYATANDGNCDTLYTIFLSYLPERLTVLDTFLVPGESLLIADTLLADPGTYDLHLTAADGCDSLLRVNVAGISTTIIEAGKESGIRIRNPLRGIGEFQAFDSRGIPLPLRELEMFTIDGRRVSRWSGLGELPATALPAGVYVYRLRLVRADGVVRGRVVVL